MSDVLCKNCGLEVEPTTHPQFPWVHVESEQTPCAGEPGREAIADLDAIIAQAKAEMETDYDLVHVEYDDRLTDEQIAMLLADDYEELWESCAEWESDNQFYGARYVVEDGLGLNERQITALRHGDRYDELFDEVRERDSGSWFKQLVRNTPAQLMRYNLEYDLDPNTVNDEEEFEQAMHDIAEAAGIDYDANLAALRTLVTEAGWYGGRLFVIWQADLEDVMRANDNAKKPGVTVTWTDPHLVVLDRINGSGMDARIAGTVTRTWNPANVRLDSADHYGWDQVAQVVHSAFSCDMALTIHPGEEATDAPPTANTAAV